MVGQIVGFILTSVFTSAIWFFIVGLSDMGEFIGKGPKIMTIVGIVCILGFFGWIFFVEV